MVALPFAIQGVDASSEEEEEEEDVEEDEDEEEDEVGTKLDVCKATEVSAPSHPNTVTRVPMVRTMRKARTHRR